MVDYFANENAPADSNAQVNGTTQQATNGEDLGMAEISVRYSHEFFLVSVSANSRQ